MQKRKKKKGPPPGTVYKDVPRTEIGEKLAALRLKRGLSQQELADLAGLTKRTISFYEREARNIPLGNITKIAQVLKVSIDTIINQLPVKEDAKESRALLKRVELLKNLPPEKQKVALALIDQLAETQAPSSTKKGGSAFPAVFALYLFAAGAITTISAHPLSEMISAYLHENATGTEVKLSAFSLVLCIIVTVFFGLLLIDLWTSVPRFIRTIRAINKLQPLIKQLSC